MKVIGFAYISCVIRHSAETVLVIIENAPKDTNPAIA